MSYQVLARKWRPRTFREMVGQEHVLQALINALDHDRLHHAYLFTGTRGVGKTTIARILAKCLNCEAGVSSEPCGQCASCVEIAEGRFVDLIEVDAASRTKVEDTRELLENVQYAPTRGRYKVYLIDEVHMLSAHSFNALLKTLEEPPPHVKFLLATTDPQKLPVTILSRCLQFNLKNMNPERIVEHLQFVLEQELVPFEDAALWHLGRAADGSMRDAMSLTDQAIAFGSGKVNEGEVRTMLGTIDQVFVYDIVKGLAALNGQMVLAAVSRLAEQAPDYAGALAELLSILHRIAIAQALPAAVDNSFGDREQVLEFAQQIPTEDLQLFYQTALLGRRDLPLAPDPRGGFEMTLLRMLAFKPQGVLDVPSAALKSPGADSSAQVSPTAPAPAAEPASVPTPLNAEPAPAVQAPVASAPAESSGDSAPVKKSEAQAGAESAAPPWATEETVQTEAPVVPESTAANKVEPEAETQNAPATPTETPSETTAAMATAESSLEAIAAEVNAQSTPKPVAPPANPTPSAPAEPVVRTRVPGKFEVLKIALEEANTDTWMHIYLGLGCGGVLQSTVSNCILKQREGNRFEFVLDERNSTLYDVSHQARLGGLLETYFQQSVEVSIVAGTFSEETPAGTLMRLKAERQAEAIDAMKGDSIVQQMIEKFSAVLQEETVTPID